MCSSSLLVYLWWGEKTEVLRPQNKSSCMICAIWRWPFLYTSLGSLRTSNAYWCHWKETMWICTKMWCSRRGCACASISAAWTPCIPAGVHVLVDPEWLQKARAEAALYTFSLRFPKEKAYIGTTTTSDPNVLKNSSSESGSKPPPTLVVHRQGLL